MTTTHTQSLQRSPRALAADAALELAVLVLLATVLRGALRAADLVRSAELLTLAGAVAVAACAVLSLRAVSDALRIGAILRSGALAAAAMLVLAAATGGLERGAAPAAAGAFVLVGSFGLLVALAAALLRDRLTAVTLVATLGALAAAAPLWLGPIAERFAPTGVLVDAIVAVTPLTFLAVLVDHDYLRAAWFYEHSALGALRYDYPSIVASSVVYALPFAAVAALRSPYCSQSRLAKELFR
jgi:hypothetical protein